MKRPLVPALATALLLAVVPAATAKPKPARPDLEVATVRLAPAAVAPGGSVALTAAVRNGGKAKARASTARVLLSRDAKVGADVVLANLRTPALKPRKRVDLRVGLAIPAATSPGDYRVLVCADGAGRVKESSEQDNCRASGALTVTAPPVTTPPVTTPPVTPTPPPASGIFPLAPDPVDVTYAVDGDRVSEPLVVSEYAGGSVTTTDAQGTTYELEVPDGAVTGLTTITMTPVTSVTGSPLPLVGAVEILPHGLQLLEAATLTITPASPVPVAAQTGFGFDGAGHDLAMMPLLRGAPVRLPLSHFSTAGLAAATDAQRTAVTPPADLGAQRDNLVAEHQRGLREALLAGETDAGGAQAVVTVQESFYSDVVRPALDAAEAAPHGDAAQQAIADALGWMRQTQLLGAESAALTDATDRAWQQVIRIWVLQGQLAAAACQEHDLGQISTLVAISRRLQLIGVTGPGEELFTDAVDCFRFTVTVSDHVTSDWGYDDGGIDRDGTGSWRLTTGPTVVDDLLSAQAAPALTATEASHVTTDHDECPGDGGPDGWTSSTELTGISAGQVLVRLELDLNVYTTPAARARARHGYVLVAVMTPPLEETAVHEESCYGDPEDRTETRLGWYERWLAFRELDPPVDGFLAGTGMLRVPVVAGEQDGAVLLEFEQLANRTMPDHPEDQVTEDLTVDLLHTPQ